MEYLGVEFKPNGRTSTSLIKKLKKLLKEYTDFIRLLLKKDINKHFVLHLILQILIPKMNYAPFYESGEHKNEYTEID